MKRRHFLMGAVAAGGPLAGQSPKRTPTAGAARRVPRGWMDVSPGPHLEGWTEYPWFDTAGTRWRQANQWHMDPATDVLLCDGLNPLRDYHSMLLSDREFEDFTFHVEWRFTEVPGAAGYNSGVLVRMLPETPQRRVMHQIECGSTVKHAGFMRGGNLENGRLTVLNTQVLINGRWEMVDPGFPVGWKPYVKSQSPNSVRPGLRLTYDVGIDGPVYPSGQWNTYEISCLKNRIEVLTNGYPSCVADNCEVPKGRLGLESEGFRIEFRNLRVKQLS
ncbi:MAG: DUF1080 domain-containing protein [Acidobacteriales bacterium]|nr:MAG: DUF1080 domain-containing protein [Terriglobales bacterium]